MYLRAIRFGRHRQLMKRDFANEQEETYARLELFPFYSRAIYFRRFRDQSSKHMGTIREATTAGTWIMPDSILLNWQQEIINIGTLIILLFHN